MKHIAAALVTFSVFAVVGVVTAAEIPSAPSILISRLADDDAAPAPPMPAAPGGATAHIQPVPDASTSAPSMDSNQPAPMMEPPIVDGAVMAAPAASGHVHNHQGHRHRPKKKQSMFSKIREMEKKKNAWFMKKFFGK